MSLPEDVHVSEACPCILRIKQSSYSSAVTAAQAPDGLEFYYDIEVDYDNWLLSGKRRLRFVSKVS